MIRSFAIITALCLCGTSASAALTIEECKAKYKAAHATKTYAGTWIAFQETKCGIHTKDTVPKPAPAAPVKH